MKKILLAILLSVFLLSAMTVPSLSQDELTVGVNVGDWFLYKSTLVEYEADEGVPFPPNAFLSFLKTYNETDWWSWTVTDVSGTTITCERVWHYKNGTEGGDYLEEDITSAVTWFIIGANLTVGDEARPPRFAYPAIIISETINWEYGNTTRETNYCEWTGTGGGSVNIQQNYWDKATGMLVKWVYNASLVLEEGNVTYLSTVELIDTSVWVIPEFPTGTVMLLIFVAVTACVGIYRRRKLKRHSG